MKKVFAIVVFILLATAAHAGEGEARFLLSSISPLSDDDNWESAFGFDIQMVNWFSPAVGVAAVIGASQWNARDVDLYDYYPDSQTSVAASLAGDATVFPVGLSVLLRPLRSRGAQVTIEAGARYAIVSSDVYARYAIESASGREYVQDRIHLDDGFYGLLAFDIGFPVSRFSEISLGAGYQFDIARGDAEFEDTNIGNTEFEAAIIRLGFNARF